MTTTAELIARLAADPPPPPFSPRRIAALAATSIVLPAAVFLLVLGPRSDMAAAWTHPAIPFKTLVPLLLCVLSLSVLLRLARPGTRVGATGWLLVMPAAIAAALWAGSFALRTPAERFADVGFVSVGECLGAILVLSIIPAITVMRALRHGAATNPSLAGAFVGLTAAAGATTGYSLFCKQDNPLFFVSWYGIAILIVTAACALIGRRYLRW